MSPIISKFPQIFIRLLVLICFVCATSSVSVMAGIAPEKVQTSLTIGVLPVEPTINQSFHVSGILKSTAGEPLGNKRIVLESSQKGTQDSEGFSSIDLVVTERDGKYEFLRPKDSPPEYLKVKFDGNDDYAPSISPVMGVRGIGTNHPQIRLGETGNIMVSTDPGGADIYVDNEYRGVTPNKVAGLTEGSHLLNLIKSGYQNETMEAYVTSDRDVSFVITMSEEGSSTKTGIGAITGMVPELHQSYHLAYTQIANNTTSNPDVAVDVSSKSMKISGNKVSDTSDISLNNSTERAPKTRTYDNVKVSTIVMNNTLGNGYDVMVIMTDH